MSESAITLHGMALSGHTHRVVLLLRALSLPYRFAETPPEALRGPELLSLNALGQIPVLQDGELVFADSNAILVYLAKRYAPGRGWLPEEPVAASRVQRWLSIAAGELMHGPAIARAIMLWAVPGDHARSVALARRLFTFMEGHLAEHDYLAAREATLADIACCTYTAHAPEGGIALAPYPAIRRWLSRVEALPGFVAMPASALPAAAASADGS
jgi:glutathione S-transferase